MENVDRISSEEIIRYALGMMSIGVRPRISQFRMLRYAGRYAKGDYAEVVAMIGTDIGLNTRLAVQFTADDFLYPVHICLTNPSGPHQKSGSWAGAVKIRKSLCAYPWEIFVALLVRDFSRILLKNANHPLATNETALDICSIALGFGPVLLQGFENVEAFGTGRISYSQFRLASNVIDSGFRQPALRVPCFVSI